MKKNPGLFIFLISLFFIVISQAFCEGKSRITFEPEIGFLNGKIVENVWYVEDDETPETITLTATDPLSRLDWQIDNTFYYGFTVDFFINDLFTFSFNFKNATSKICGIMEDYDWLDDSDHTKLSKYSNHTNFLENMTHINCSIGRIFYIGNNRNISITPEIGFEAENIRFSGIGGWNSYDINNYEIRYFEDGKKVISYSQTYTAPIISFLFDFNYLKYLETNINVSATWIKQLDCLDRHYLRTDLPTGLFNDRIQNAWKFGVNFGMYYKINPMHKYGIKGDITYIPPSYGFTYSSKTSTSPDPTSLGGTSRLLWNYSFVYVFSF